MFPSKASRELSTQSRETINPSFVVSKGAAQLTACGWDDVKLYADLVTSVNLAVPIFLAPMRVGLIEVKFLMMGKWTNGQPPNVVETCQLSRESAMGVRRTAARET